MMKDVTYQRQCLSSFQIIILGFAGVILLGAFLLMLPISSVSGQATPFHESLFTATSAVCVTGLVVQSTGCYWSWFGQAVILVLIQIGGLGVVTVAVAFALLSGRNITLMATQHNARCPFCTEGGWHCPVNAVCSTRNFFDRVIGSFIYASYLLPGLWLERVMDGSVPFRFCFL